MDELLLGHGVGCDLEGEEPFSSRTLSCERARPSMGNLHFRGRIWPIGGESQRGVGVRSSGGEGLDMKSAGGASCAHET
jgi:hypothetical protein